MRACTAGAVVAVARSWSQQYHSGDEGAVCTRQPGGAAGHGEQIFGVLQGTFQEGTCDCMQHGSHGLNHAGAG